MTASTVAHRPYRSLMGGTKTMEEISPYRRKYEAIFIFRSGEIHLMRIRGCADH
jgi:hypothetical protein